MGFNCPWACWNRGLTMDILSFSIIAEALSVAMIPSNMLAVALGVAAGVILGAIPGLSGTMAIALMIPLTFHWTPLFSISILMGCWKGSVYGGSISAILLNTPGTPEAAPTAMDGYPMVLKGKAMQALMMALVASVAGALMSDAALILGAPLISQIAVKFGPADLASLILLSLVIVSGSGSNSILKGLIATSVGLILGSIGLDPISAERRLTFGILHLDQGLDLLALTIGLLVMSEVFVQFREELARRGGASRQMPIQLKGAWLKLSDLKRSAGVIFRSSIIGSVCGALPGVGSITAAFMGYDQAKVTSGHPETFGKGEIKGVAASEAANNAVCGTALVPMLTLGIPGSLSVAIIMGAFMIHGLAPGPLLMSEEPVFVYALFMLLILSDILLFFIPLPIIPLAARLSSIRRSYLLPAIAFFCVVGAYSTQQSLFDVEVMAAFGVVGYFFKRWGISPAALLIAFILGPMAETNLRLALTLSGGDATVFVSRPYSAAFRAWRS
ncbi:tripartite tricarboxylate transporter permease [Rhodobacteraceae bacterium D3-12]|nr:tripartite tricarboxylate transporter permease [Rhodobacteraceae bacterium D3-12]